MNGPMNCAVCDKALTINQGALCSHGCEILIAAERDTLKTTIRHLEIVAADVRKDRDDLARQLAAMIETTDSAAAS